MENAIVPPSSRSFARSSPSSPQRTEASSAPGEGSAGYAIAATSAFVSVAGLSLWGLGVVGSFDGPSAVLFGAQVAGGVIVTIGFAAQAIRTLRGDR